YRLAADPAKLAAVVRAVDDVLDAIAREAAKARAAYGAFFSPEKPVLSIISGLAEGTDRIAARAAIARRQAPKTSRTIVAEFFLDVSLPFAAEMYSADFPTPASKDEFTELQKHARSILAMPGERGRPGETKEQAKLREDRSYEAGGQTVLNQADILLTVWDG